MTGRKFTWANYAEVPTYEKLDRILVTTEWEQKKFRWRPSRLSPKKSLITHHSYWMEGNHLTEATLGILNLS
jgi:hypothetical protein